MTISTYDDLVSSVKTWTARNDSTFSGSIPVFVETAEQRIFFGFGEPKDPMYSPPLRCKEIETIGSIAMTNGEGTLPSGYLDMRALSRSGDETGIVALSPREFRVESEKITGTVPYYATVESSTLKVAPSYTGTLDMLYWVKPTALSASSQTNTVLTNFPSIYLYATLVEAFGFIRDDAEVLRNLSKLVGLIKGLNKTDMNIRYSTGTHKMRSRAIG